tara:strand:- start:112 stop:564 length:453 start_codon:yes stop_codon:yes gene_type:complete
MSDTPKSAPAPAAKSEPKAAAKAIDAAPASSGGETGKSARESVGGPAVGHYGYFSNIKTPEYKSGWDDIWGKPAKSGKSGTKKKAAGSNKAAPKKQEPRVVSLDFEDLPADLQAGLATAARARLKKLRVSYDARDKAGAIRWRLDCTVER